MNQTLPPLSNHSHGGCLSYGGVSSVIFSTALFLQPTANPSPSPGCWTILNHIHRSEIPSSCQSPFLLFSTPPLQPLSRLLGNSPAPNHCWLGSKAISFTTSCFCHYAILVFPPYVLYICYITIFCLLRSSFVLCLCKTICRKKMCNITKINLENVKCWVLFLISVKY